MSKPTKSVPPKSFESAVSELESLVATMEVGSLSLEDSMAAYKRGIELSGYCQKALAEAEQQIKILDGGLLKNFSPVVANDADEA